MTTAPWMWGLFALIVAGLLALDLGVVRRQDAMVTTQQAAFWTILWWLVALGFAVFIHQRIGHEKSFQFLQAWLLEQALSIDNVFVFVVIFQYFKVPREQQHRVLFWGVLGAVLTRGAFIVGGVAVVERFHVIMYVLGAFLIFTAVRLLVHKDQEFHPDRNPALRFFRRAVPSTDEFHGRRFFVREHGRLMATPLFMVLAVVEVSDVLFAVDSIPAVLGVTTDVFIVYTSNIFAILGLRSLFFLIEGLMQKLRFLKTGVAVILAFIGVKILVEPLYRVPVLLSLGTLAGVLAVATTASLLFPERNGESP